jgi:N-acetylglucosaminyl-diphospho-decaprenol L-rhamnosyltransferase
VKFSIIVVNYNSGPRLDRCLKAIAAQSFAKFEVLIVDNASADGSEKTPLPDDRFRMILAGKNLGFAAGNNLAAKQAKGEWLFLVNPDAYLESECLTILHHAILRYPDCALFGCTQLDDAAPTLLDGSGDCYYFTGYPWRGGKGWGVENLPDEGEVWGPCGGAYLVKREVYEKAGGFDEDFFCYCEDVDLNFRLRLQGHKAIQVVEAFLRHEGSAITGKQSEFSVFHGTRNRVWAFVKNMPDLFFWPLLPFHLLTVGLQLFDPGTSPARWKGLKAAWEGMPTAWKKRQEIQSKRTASLWQLARAFTYNPFTFVWRRADVRKPATN